MANGSPLTINEARQYIQAFEDFEKDHNEDLNLELGIGQKIDILVLQKFMAAIAAHPKTYQIDAVRVYLARSRRSGQNADNYDIVLVPVLSDGNDLHKIYDNQDANVKLNTIIGQASPCPNVCLNVTFR